MKQILIRKGKVGVYEVNSPSIKKGYLKIRVLYSTVSVGTEMSTVKGTEKSIIRRAIEDPSKVIQVLDILRSQGLKNAQSKVSSATEKLSSIGYSVAGEVLEIGDGCELFKVGDLVSAGGSGFAIHANEVIVPKNLVVKIPVGLDMASASTGTVGSIALHGVRRADLKLGEYAVVFGTGLLGLLTLQLLKASGLKVACIDINEKRLSLAQELNADLVINSLNEDPVNAIKSWSGGFGVDAVLFMASTDQDEPLSQAFRMCRRKGKVVLVGVSGMNINRNDIYRDEIDFLISSSYGPGRYDDKYEIKGEDYPYAYVRWTENRNIESYLNLLQEDKISLKKINPRIYNFQDAESAYENIKADPESHILTILSFSDSISEEGPIQVNSNRITKDKITIGLIGAGSFATNTLLPILQKHSDKFLIKAIYNNTGEKAINAALQFKANEIVHSKDDIFTDPEIDLVMICTRHANHAALVLEGLKNNKHVYVEKPLAINCQQLNEIIAFYENKIRYNSPILMVGFNRRFSKYIIQIKKKLVVRSSPMIIHYRMNAGFVSYDSWIHEDGGRIIGEACHMIDLMSFLTDSKVSDFSVATINVRKSKYQSADNRSITLTFEDGSIGVIDYFSCGSKDLSKEYLEVHFDNKTIILDDYRELTGYGIKIKSNKQPVSQKGHEEEWVSIFDNLKSGNWPISLDSLVNTTKVSIFAAE